MDLQRVGFARIFKVDEAKREVWGIATEEVPDSDNEMFDYASSADLFKEWSAHAEEVTHGKSKGTIRYMHQLDACGKVIDIQFDDVNKRINIGAKIVDDSVWNKIVEGVLTGFSIGGKALKRWKDSVDKHITRFTAKPVEISVVDVPCLPTAVFEMIKADGTVESRHFKEARMPDPTSEFAAKLEAVWQDLQVLKAESKTKRVAGEDLPSSAFAYVGDKDRTETWKLPIKFSSEDKTKRHIRNALSRFSQTQGIPDEDKPKVHARIVAAAKKYGIEVEEEEKKAQNELDLLKSALTSSLESKLKKSMGSISDLACILQQLYWVKMDAAWEAMYEGEGGDERDAAIAVEIQAAMQHIAEILNAVVEDEVSELLVEKAASAEKEVSMHVEEIVKAAGSLLSHFKKAAAFHGKKGEFHKALAEHHGTKAEEHKAMIDSGLEEVKSIHKSMYETHKAKAAHHESMSDVHKSMADHMSKMADCVAEKSEEVEMLKAASSKTGTGTTDPEKETDNMTPEDVTKAVQAGIASLDLNKAAKEAVNASEFVDALVDKIVAKMKTEVKPEPEKPVEKPVEKSEEKTPKFFAIPRGSEFVAKAAEGGEVRLRSENDNGW